MIWNVALIVPAYKWRMRRIYSSCYVDNYLEVPLQWKSYTQYVIQLTYINN